MIIDTHAHVMDEGWPPESEKGIDEYQMIDAMDKNHVVETWISPTTGLVRDYKINNDKMYTFTRHNPKRLIPFYTVNPNYSGNVIDEIKRCKEYLGGKGLKLHPWLQAFSVNYRIVDQIVETCIDCQWPILFHDGTPPYSDSLQIANLAERYPEAKIILGHAGLFDTYRSAIAAAKQFKNIYLCLCGPAIGDIKEMISKVDHSRLLFGSDFGSADVKLLSERIQKIEYATEDQELRNKLFYENARQLI